ncbi:chorismate synthase [Candidatus Vidania fulgoroideae]|nr:chorismate synthase [Candidatus Vidania fulgoroideae]
MSNILGNIFKVLTFGESHGKILGCLIDGIPSGFYINKYKIQKELNLRKPGKNSLVSLRKEQDKLKIISGLFCNRTTGTPLGLIVFNKNKRSLDYKNISKKFRPGHADYTYYKKYNIRDYKGGGRASARTTVSIVLAGSICKYILKDIYCIDFFSFISCIGGSFNNNNFCKSIKKTIKDNNSLGSSVNVSVGNIPNGIGEPLFKKIESEISKTIIGLNAVKAIEFGSGIKCSLYTGSKNNDNIYKNGFKSNNSGGMLGGISTGQNLKFTVHIKPTSSISKKQNTVDENFLEEEIEIMGRHDPCIGLRIIPIIESAIAIVIFDLILKHKFSYFF